MAGSDRYQRQLAFRPVGPDGQARLGAARAAILGMGALGTAIANSLCRAGFGFLRLVDGDVVEESNLQRQMLFGEADVGAPKALAAAAHLARINSKTALEPLVMRVDASNIAPLVSDVDVVLDGSDNFELRYAANDACLRAGVPWIYGGVLGAEGVTMDVLPGGPCLRCLMPEPPRRGSFATPETEGVLNQITAVIGSIEAVEAMKLALGGADLRRTLLSVSLWNFSVSEVAVKPDPACPVCGKRAGETGAPGPR